ALAETLRTALGLALADLGEEVVDGKESLSDRIDRAQSVSKSVDHEASERRALYKEIDKLENDRSDLEEKTTTALQAWREWETCWAAAMEKIGQPADIAPMSALAVLDLNSTFFDRRNEAIKCRRKLEEMEREAARFGSDVLALAGRV